MLPNFLIIGAQKGGTTWLAEQLRSHPDVFMPQPEIHYFDKDFNYGRGPGWYEQHFSSATNQVAIGEKTPDYLWANGRGVEGHLPEVHKNIYKLLPDIKLIISLRNPVERAISALNHVIRTSRVSPHFTADELLLGTHQHLIQGHGVLEYGCYFEQIDAYLTLFAREQLLILLFEEDIVAYPAQGLSKVCQFLSIDETYKFPKKNEKKNVYRHSQPRLYLNYYLPFLRPFSRPFDRLFPEKKASIRQDTIDKLYAYYESPNQKLFRFLDREIPVSWTNS